MTFAQPATRRRAWLALLAATVTLAAAEPPAAPHAADDIAALKARIAELERRMPAPELGQQMLDLQLRHDRLWWAGHAGNWNLAYFMVGELGEALRGIEASNGDAAELQPDRLAEVMPAMMNPAIRAVQQALEKKDPAAFAKAYDGLSAACTACHQRAGVEFLHIQRPHTPLLDNLRYQPAAPAAEVRP